MLELEPQATEAAAALGAAINESPLKNDPQAAVVGQMIAEMSEGDDDPGWTAALGDIQTTGPDTATINITATDQEFGMTIPPSFSAHRTGGGWKIVNLPNPSGQQHTPEAMRSLIAGLRDMTAKVKSGEIFSGAELQQAAMSLMPG
jgi:hypothetical protein